MPTAIEKNGQRPAEQVPTVPSRPWEQPIYTWQAVDPVPVMLDRERHLLFTNRALKTIQRETGKNPFDGQQWDDLSRDPDGLTILLRAGLLHESPDLTIEEVDEWVILPRVGYYRERLWYAYRDAMPDPEPATANDAASEASDDPNPEPAPTG